jgi:hypothetical protein
VPVATPLPVVGPASWVRVFPVPDAESDTVEPLTGLPNCSRTVTVTVELPLPAAIEAGLALTLDCEAEGGPAVTVTGAVCSMGMPLISAETVLVYLGQLNVRGRVEAIVSLNLRGRARIPTAKTCCRGYVLPVTRSGFA